MKVNLLFKDKNYVEPELSDSDSDTQNDLWMYKIIDFAALGDPFIKSVYSKIKGLMLNNKADILYRQEIVCDFINNENAISELYKYFGYLVDIIEKEHFIVDVNKVYKTFTHSVSIMNDILNLLRGLSEYLVKIKPVIKAKGLMSYANRFSSVFTSEYLDELEHVYRRLSFPNGIFVMGGLDKNFRLDKFVIYDSKDKLKTKSGKNISNMKGEGFFDKFKYNKASIGYSDVYTEEIKKWNHKKEIDSSFGYGALEAEYERQSDMAVLPFARKVVPMVKDIIDFIYQSKYEFAFYMGAINLRKAMDTCKMPYCLPKILDVNTTNLKCKNLYDLALLLVQGKNVIGNDLDINNKPIIYISGANQGGKTTFLRSYGQAMILAQAGLIVPAKELSISLVDNLYTHFNKSEDKSMNYGRLDEELRRLSNIINTITPNSMILFNESFTSTNEKEGSKIAIDIIKALYEKKIKVTIVSHMYMLANSVNELYKDETAFLRAERNEDGSRSYRLCLALPEETSYAIDLYNMIFKKD